MAKIHQCIEAHNPKTQTPQELEQKLDNVIDTYGLNTVETALTITQAQIRANHQPQTHHYTPEWRKQGFESWNDHDHFNHQWYKND